MTAEEWRYVLRVDGRDIELLDGEVTLGRSRTATVRVDHESVSRTHAMLTFRKGDAIVKDLNSSNGTYVGGRRVLNETRLADGDRIQLGAAVVGFKIVSPGAPADRTALIGSEPASSAPPPAVTPDGPVPSLAAAPSAAPRAPEPPEAIEAPPSLRPEKAMPGSVPAGPTPSVAVPALPPPSSVLPPAPPPPEPIPLELSGEPMDTDVGKGAAALDAAAELAAAAKEAVRLSQVASSPSAPPLAPAPPAPAASAPPPPTAAQVATVPLAPSAPAPMPPPLDAPPTPPREVAPAPRPSRPVPALSKVPIRDEPPRTSPDPTGRIAPENVAGFLPRLAAWLVDSVILLALNLIFMSPVFLILFFRPELKAREAGSDWTLALISGLSSLVIVAANFWYLVGGWAKSGRTPGKALLGLAIVRGDRRAPAGLGWRTAIIRAVGYVLSSLCLLIGFLVVLFRKDKRAWHDLIADTWVVWVK